MKRFGQLLMVALLANVVWTSSAQAAPVSYFNCKVDRAAIVGVDAVVMRVSDLSSTAAFTNTYVLGSTPIANQMLAVALTAMSLGTKVFCRIDFAVSPPRISILYVTSMALP